jgi:periplasmic divalent cation tolerance protein
MNMSEAIVILTTVEEQKSGEALAQMLVEKRVAACVQVMPAMISVYRWENHLEYATESLLLIKTTRDCYSDVEKAIRENHRYETPEIIALPVVAGATDYLQWLTGAVSEK